MENALSKNKIKYSKCFKGDFSLDVNSDLIVSIGFQGSAIKSAFAFNKPIIFFSSDKNYFEEITFFDDEVLNDKVIKSFNELVFGITELELLLSNKSNIQKSLNKLLYKTNNFLELIEINNQTINVSSFLEDL